MSDVNKMVLNGAIMKMRARVLKAKKLLTLSLVRKINKLKDSKSEYNKEKKTKIVDRIIAEKHNIKIINVDEVTKYAFINKKPLSEAVRNCSLKDRTIAKLADQKVVKEAIESFRLKYPSWDVQVPSLYKIWDIEKKFTGLSSSMDKNNTADGRLPDKTTQNDIQATSTDIERSTSQGSDKEVGVSEDVYDDDDGDDGIQRQVASSESDDDGLDFDVESIRSSGNKLQADGVEGSQLNPPNVVARIDTPEKSQKSESILKGTTTVNQKEREIKKMETFPVKRANSEMEVRRINLADFDDGEEEILVDEMINVPQAMDESSDTKQKVKSSFFLDSDEEEQLDDERHGNTQSVRKSYTEKEEEEFRRSNYGQRPFDRNQQKRRGQFRNMSGPLNRTERRKLLRKTMEKEPPIVNTVQEKLASHCSQEYLAKTQKHSKNNLHPSWEAKKKANEQKIVAFQGNKIVFDD